jgi:hypothetical protein
MINGVSIMITLFFGLNYFGGSKSLGCIGSSMSKFAHLGSAMTTSARVQIPFLVNTMSICL